MHLPGLTLQNYKGTLALCGPSLVTAHSHHAPHIPSPPFPLHITLLTPAEYKSIGKPSVANVEIPTHHVYALGLGHTSRQVRWLVIAWNHANKWRKAFGLPNKEFHLTLSAEDDWDAAKGVPSLLSGGLDRIVVLERLLKLGEEGMDHAVVASGGSDMHEELIQSAICHFPDSYRGYVRLAEAKRLTQPKLSLLCYARAVSLNSGPQLLRTIVKKMLAMRSSTSYGPMVTAEELAAIPADLAPYLLQPFPQVLDDELAPHLWTFSSVSRERQLHLGENQLPRFFTWLYPHRLSGMSTPRTAAEIEILQDMGVTHVLTLTEEEPLPAEWFAFRSISNLFVPVANYHAPTLEEMDSIYQRVRRGGTWLVHCGGGKGRAGTVLSCLIAMIGLDGAVSGEEEGTSTPQMDGRTAMATIRSLRPGSLESKIQEDFVTQWISHRWQMAYKATVPIDEPWTQLQQEVNRKVLPQGVQPGSASVLFLVGRPGSGKSWLSESLVKRRPRGSTIVISQDESGSRASCETMLGGTYPANTLLIVDRCNPEANDRKTWLSLIQTGQVIAIYFDYSLELCRQRVNQRLDHPTIKAGRGGPALRQMDKMMAPPTLAEDFAAVLTISSFAAAQEAVLLLSGHPPITKFPRTTHLLNLGAITNDDLVQAEFQELENAHLTLEEKVDGANMGFSLDFDKKLLVQNRSHYISHAEHAQFKPLKVWLERHGESLRILLDRDPLFPERYILYGEWCVAQHSIAYNRLPSPFLAFDFFDRVTGAFLSRRMLATALGGSGIHQVPLIEESSSLTREHLMGLMSRRSEFADGPIEGVYVRFEDARRRVTLDRGKVVRGDFLSGNKHWTKGPLIHNGILMAEDGGCVG